MGARNQYRVWNSATAALTAAPISVTTGTSIKTMLQLKPTSSISIIEWGFMFDIVPTAVVNVELLTTGTVAATVTASAAGDVVKWGDGSGGASVVTVGTTATGYTASAEGTVTASRLLDFEPAWVQSYKMQWPLDREPSVASTDYLRIRMTTATAINARCFITWEE